MTLRDERGSVVAEFAVAMPAVLLVLGVMLGGIQLTGLQLRAQDAAADAARSWARGESGAVVAEHLARQLPAARVTRSSRGDLVCATVRVSGRGPSARLGVTVAATACALGGGR
jgi:Flp pilus assembly protein TadG